jgi:hypothetical protein
LKYGTSQEALKKGRKEGRKEAPRKGTTIVIIFFNL